MGKRVDQVKIRAMVAKLIHASGCSCCRDDSGWYAAIDELGAVLDVPKYDDGSGYDFSAARLPTDKEGV